MGPPARCECRFLGFRGREKIGTVDLRGGGGFTSQTSTSLVWTSYLCCSSPNCLSCVSICLMLPHCFPSAASCPILGASSASMNIDITCVWLDDHVLAKLILEKYASCFVRLQVYMTMMEAQKPGSNDLQDEVVNRLSCWSCGSQGQMISEDKAIMQAQQARVK